MTNEEQGGTPITLTVDGSRPLIHADGTTAIMLETRERGTMAFLLDRKAMDALRQHLIDLEISALRFAQRLETI